MTKTAKTVPPKKTQVDLKIEEAMTPAVVTLTVDDLAFVNVLENKNLYAIGSGVPVKNRNTVAKMKMANSPDHPRVFIKPNEPDRLKIKTKGAAIHITIKPDGFFPIGVAFQLKEGVPNPTDLDRLGLLNFGTTRMYKDPHTIQIADYFKDEEGDNKYKFSVIIQRASDGALGIIDPGIDHVP